MTSDGRIDLLIRTERYVYIIECKINQSAEVALQQIRDKQYQLPWALERREVIGVGLNFSTESRRPNGWKWEKLNNVLHERSNVPHKKKNVPHEVRVERIKQLLRENPTITRQEIADKLHMSMKTIARDIEKMSKVKYVGSGDKGHWIVD